MARPTDRTVRRLRLRIRLAWIAGVETDRFGEWDKLRRMGVWVRRRDRVGLVERLLGGGIEAEEFLVDEGRKLLKKNSIEAELWHGNFLPSSAESIAENQADHPCLHHPVPAAYAEHECELSDFAVVFAYPWPGEEHYQREVFRTFAAEGTLLFMFRGPYQIELYRKVTM